MKLSIEKSVTVITPTIGQEYVCKAIESVQAQSYKNVNHLIVVDGHEFAEQFRKTVVYENLPQNVQISIAPYNTGGGGFYGHRVYAAYPHLINTDYIAFLDEDNWFEPDHIKSLVDTIETQNLDWAYSLRNIYSKEGEFIAEDCCESLGKWPIFWADMRNPEFLVDTSSYLFKREVLNETAHHWHFGWGGDRRFYYIISNHYEKFKYHTNGKHTMNYRLDDAMEKKYGSLDFFFDGNKKVLERHGGKYPWLET